MAQSKQGHSTFGDIGSVVPSISQDTLYRSGISIGCTEPGLLKAFSRASRKAISRFKKSGEEVVLFSSPFYYNSHLLSEPLLEYQSEPLLRNCSHSSLLDASQ